MMDDGVHELTPVVRIAGAQRGSSAKLRASLRHRFLPKAGALVLVIFQLKKS
jgi:hypothetical protein